MYVYDPRIVHDLACTVQPTGNTGMGKVFTFDCLGWSNIVQVRSLLNWWHHCTAQFVMFIWFEKNIFNANMSENQHIPGFHFLSRN